MAVTIERTVHVSDGDDSATVSRRDDPNEGWQLQSSGTVYLSTDDLIDFAKAILLVVDQEGACSPS